MKSAIEAYKTGDSLAARLNFQAALREDPHNTVALLWLAYIATDPEKQIFLLERVLQIDPGNERAQKGLAWVKNRIVATATQASAEINSSQSQTPAASSTPTPVVIAVEPPGLKQSASPPLEAASDLDKKSEPADLKEQGKKESLPKGCGGESIPCFCYCSPPPYWLSCLAGVFYSARKPSR